MLRSCSTVRVFTAVRRPAVLTPLRAAHSKLMPDSHAGNSQEPRARATLSGPEAQRISQGNLSDYNIYSELEPPANNIEKVLKDGFVLGNGSKVRCEDISKPVGLVLLGSESYQIDMTDSLEGLDSGIVEFGPQITGILEIIEPKPDILVVGLGLKSRILGDQTSEFIRSLGIRIQLSNTENAASYFDLLATERRSQIGAILLPPNL